MPGGERNVVIFDLGGVLIDWDPRHLYRRLFGADTAAMEAFLAEVCTTEWNELQDAGRSFAEAEAEAIARHPDKRDLITAWARHFDEMIPGAITGSVDVLADLHAAGVPLYALSNWSAETFPSQRTRFDFLAWFDGIVLSGEEQLIKPDARIYRRLLERYGVDPARAAYVDDVGRNAAAARELGIHGIHFTAPAQLRDELAGLGLLPATRT
jgi:2-haloacid dehalogenase